MAISHEGQEQQSGRLPMDRPGKGELGQSSSTATPVRGVIGEPGFKFPVPVGSGGNSAHVARTVSVERSFARYLADLDKEFQTAPSDYTTANIPAMESTVWALRCLREFAVLMVQANLSEVDEWSQDPFFTPFRVPSLTMVRAGEFPASHVMPLSDYLSRLESFHLPFPLDPFLSRITSTQVCVGVTGEKEEMNHHYLILPQPEDLLHEAVANQLLGPEPY